MQGQRLGSVPRHGGEQGLLVPPPGYPERDRPAAAGRQPFLDCRRVRRQHGHEDFARHGAVSAGLRPAALGLPGAGASDGVLAVHLAEEMLDELTCRHVLDLVNHPAPLPADPPAADVEDLHGGLKLILGQRDDIAVGAIAEDDSLLLQGTLERLDVIAEPGGPLELLSGGSLAHLGLEPPDEPGRLARHEVAELLGEEHVLLGAHPANARRGALADVAEQAGPADLAGPLEDARGARPYREYPQQRVDRVPDRPGMGVGTEVADPAPLGAPHDRDPGILLGHCHRQVRIALVVPVPDVEPRVELLDPRILQLQRLDLSADDCPVHRGRRAQH